MENFDKTVSTGVVIIGAGIAGLGAAQKLEQSNFKDYILLEAQSQVGGRICSIPWKNSWLEKGAQFVHGLESVLAQSIVEKNLLSDENVAEGQGLYYREDGTLVKKKIILEVDDFVRDTLERLESYSDFPELCCRNDDDVGKILRREFESFNDEKDESPLLKTIKEELFDWNVRFVAIDNACTYLDELSVKKWGDYQAVNGPECSIFKTHYGSIVESIVEDLTQDNVNTCCPVKKIEYNVEQVISKSNDNYDNNNNNPKKPIVVTLENGKVILADCAIVTCSLGYLKNNHESLFSPGLPKSYVDTIEKMGFGLINKVFLDFEEPWWELKTKGFQFLWKLKEEEHDNNKKSLANWTRDLTGFDVVPTQPSVLVGWIGGRGAEIIEKLNEEEIIKDCAQLFRYFLKNDNVPEASRCLRTSWRSNKYVRGAYCHITKKCDDSDCSPSVLAKPIYGKVELNDKIERLPILMMAGEATHAHFYSTTHGAYDTGVKQAEIFLRHHLQT